jgi:putative FmdB family regulatory protein
MPLYEYECTTCHRRTEKIQKFSDPEITVCPYCTGHLERVISAPAISFKGGGWYADGYGNAKPKSASDGASKGASSNGSTASNGSSSGDSKTSTDSSSTPAPAPAAATAAPAPASSSADKK